MLYSSVFEIQYKGSISAFLNKKSSSINGFDYCAKFYFKFNRIKLVFKKSFFEFFYLS